MALSLRRKYRPLSFLFPSLDPISVPSSGLLPCGLRREDKGGGSGAGKSSDSSASPLALALPDWDLWAGLRSALRLGRGYPGLLARSPTSLALLSQCSGRREKWASHKQGLEPS